MLCVIGNRVRLSLGSVRLCFMCPVLPGEAPGCLQPFGLGGLTCSPVCDDLPCLFVPFLVQALFVRRRDSSPRPRVLLVCSLAWLVTVCLKYLFPPKTCALGARGSLLWAAHCRTLFSCPLKERIPYQGLGVTTGRAFAPRCRAARPSLRPFRCCPSGSSGGPRAMPFPWNTFPPDPPGKSSAQPPSPL